LLKHEHIQYSKIAIDHIRITLTNGASLVVKGFNNILDDIRIKQIKCVNNKIDRTPISVI